MNCKVLCGKNAVGTVGRNIITFLPDLENITYYKNKLSAVILNNEDTLSHSYIFLKCMGITVVSGVSGLSYGDRVKIDVGASTVTVKGKARQIYRPSLMTTVLSLPFPYSEYPVGLWRTEGMLLGGIRNFAGDYKAFSKREPDGIIRLFDLEGDKASLGAGMEEKLRQRQLFDLSNLESAKILIPNVRNIGDILFVKSRLFALCGAPHDYQIGSMVENAEGFASLSDIIKESDFISIGLNGLLRTYRTAGAALSAAVKICCEAVRNGKDCTVCGELLTRPDVFYPLCSCKATAFCFAPEDIPYAETMLGLAGVPEQLCFL